VAAVLVGGFALFGYLTKPSTNAWSQDKPVVIVDTDSGVVFFTLDGKMIFPATKHHVGAAHHGRRHDRQGDHGGAGLR